MGLLSETLKYPLGLADLQPGVVLVALGGSVLEQPPHVVQQQHLPNLTMISPWATQTPQSPDERLGLCTCLLNHDPCVKNTY